MKVHVINKNGNPLMPCTPAKARHLLKAGKAKCIKRTPFTIKLLWDCEENTQEQEWIQAQKQYNDLLNSSKKIIPGALFGKLTVLREVEPEFYVFKRRKKGKRKVLKRVECKCTCGNLRIVHISSLLKIRITSCGCTEERYRIPYTAIPEGMVRVVDSNGNSITPCKSTKAKRLLEKGKAKCIQREPFTIKLLWCDEQNIPYKKLKLKEPLIMNGVIVEHK